MSAEKLLVFDCGRKMACACHFDLVAIRLDAANWFWLSMGWPWRAILTHSQF